MCASSKNVSPVRPARPKGRPTLRRQVSKSSSAHTHTPDMHTVCRIQAACHHLFACPPLPPPAIAAPASDSSQPHQLPAAKTAGGAEACTRPGFSPSVSSACGLCCYAVRPGGGCRQTYLLVTWLVVHQAAVALVCDDFVECDRGIFIDISCGGNECGGVQWLQPCSFIVVFICVTIKASGRLLGQPHHHTPTSVPASSFNSTVGANGSSSTLSAAGYILVVVSS